MNFNILKKYRFWVLFVAALAVIGWYWSTDPDGGAETVARLQWLSWMVVVSGPVYLLRRALMDGARSREAYQTAILTPIGSGMVFIGLCILTGLLFIALAGQARGEDGPPEQSIQYLPVLNGEISDHWPDVSSRAVLAAQTEQETCTSLKSPKCWNPRTELKTDREYGFGLGQLTVTKQFDNFAEARKLHPSMRSWNWSERYDPHRQLRAMVLMDKAGFNRLKTIKDQSERMAMAFSAYNGGMGGVLADRRVCAGVKGCDPGKWFGNVELHSLKAKTAARGYGQSFYQINRGYVRAVMITRRAHYAHWFGEV